MHADSASNRGQPNGTRVLHVSMNFVKLCFTVHNGTTGRVPIDKESTTSFRFTSEPAEKNLKLNPVQVHSFDKPISNFYYSPTGRQIAFATSGLIHIVDSETFAVVSTITSDIVKNFEEVDFSPLGNYLVTYILPDKQSEVHNLCIWNVADGRKLAGWSLRNKFCWPMFQWTQDESQMLALLTKGTLSIYTNNDYSLSSSHLSKARVSQFFVGPGKDPYICLFVPVKASEPGFIEVYRLSKPDIPLKKQSFFVDSLEMLWNKDGNAFFILINKDVDKDNYYGKKTIQFCNLQNKVDSSVTESFVHDALWNPNGKEFVIIHGDMPHPKITIFDLKAVRRLDFMVGEARNKLLFDPTGRILMVGGFGSLGGEIDFWDMTKPDIVKMGHAKAFSTTHHSWSPDGYYLLASCLNSRLKVDNGIKIYNIYGLLLEDRMENELSQVEWKRLPVSSYPTRILHAPNAKKIEIQEKGPEKYRHPNFTGNKTPIGGKPATTSSAPVRYDNSGNAARPQIGGQVKQGGQQPQNSKPKPKKKATPQPKTVVIEEFEQPTF